jgi:predicted DNA-binding transcriptional regulator AlpA
MRKHSTPSQPFISSIDWQKLPRLFTTTQVAEFLGIKEKTLREWRSKNSRLSPMYVRIGRSVYYERDALRLWYDETILDQLRRKWVIPS